ncbi:hypothetical protein [Streptomyces sp900116325]|uniref:hypothetical protein n=1 Tax=Streptomyces sp. 900116325 TaxID=3154295 RepID=UPI0033A06B93
MPGWAWAATRASSPRARWTTSLSGSTGSGRTTCQPCKAAPTGGHTAPAVQTLSDHAGALNRLLGTRRRVAHGYATAQNTPIDHLGTRHDSFDELIDALTAAAAPSTSAMSA